MKLKLTFFSILVCLMLSGCGASNEPVPINTAPPEEVFTIPEQEQEKTQINFKLNGTTETVPAYVYEGMDYTIVIPDGGWHMYEPGAWQATFNQSIKFYIKGYSGDNAKKLIEQLSSQGYVLGYGGNVMTKNNSEDGLIENVMVFRNGDSMRAVFYCYTPETASNFGVRLDTIVNTFSWKDPQENATSGNLAGLTEAELQEALKAPAAIIETQEGQSPQAAQISLIIASAEEKSKKLEAMLESHETQSDMNITSAELYSVWDDAINSVWKILRESMDERDFDYLLDQQLLWIERKEIAVNAAAAEYQGGSMASLAANQKATELTRERVYELAKYME